MTVDVFSKGITWDIHCTKLPMSSNETVKQKVGELIGDYELLLKVAFQRKPQWFGLTTRRPGSLPHNAMHG